jgi:hypothetical protein
MHHNELTCANHPQRAAVENCEVCGKPLCNYCLYYTDDGQRLCREHAVEAAKQGLGFNPPDTYSTGILSAQARASQDREAELDPDVSPKGAQSGPTILYRANNTDLMAFVGMIAGFFTVLSLCGAGGLCIPVVGAGLSVAAIIDAKKAVDTKRARLQGWIGLAASGTLLLAMVATLAFCFWSIRASNDFVNNQQFNYTPPPTLTPLPTRTSAPIKTLTPTPQGLQDANPDDAPSALVPDMPVMFSIQ